MAKISEFFTFSNPRLLHFWIFPPPFIMSLLLFDSKKYLSILTSLLIACPNYRYTTDTHLSAPAHDNILLILTMWKGWSLMRMWKASLPAILIRYLLQQIRPASRASLESCSNSLDTIWMHSGKSSTTALLRPKSKILIFESKMGNCYVYNQSVSVKRGLEYFYTSSDI